MFDDPHAVYFAILLAVELAQLLLLIAVAHAVHPGRAERHDPMRLAIGDAPRIERAEGGHLRWGNV